MLEKPYYPHDSISIISQVSQKSNKNREIFPSCHSRDTYGKAHRAPGAAGLRGGGLKRIFLQFCGFFRDAKGPFPLSKERPFACFSLFYFSNRTSMPPLEVRTQSARPPLPGADSGRELPQ